MNTQNYNGWTNYATWRINLEVIDGLDIYDATAELLESMAEEIIFGHIPIEGTLAEDYARAFLADVNWEEIATHINDENALQPEPKEAL